MAEANSDEENMTAPAAQEQQELRQCIEDSDAIDSAAKVELTEYLK